MMSVTELRDRRNAGTPARIFSIESDALVWRGIGDGGEGRMALASVRQVRLAIAMAGQSSQVVCRVTDDAGHEAVFGSMRWAGVGQWEANARDFRDLLRALHLGLREQPGPVRYLEGSTTSFLAIMTGLGALLALVGAGAFTKLFLIDENAIGLALIPAIALGVWLMRLFWPRAAKTYDPTTYTVETPTENPDPAGESDPALAGKEGSVTPR
jgi:hypothetical protein